MARSKKPKNTLTIPLPSGLSPMQKTLIKVVLPLVLAAGAWLTGQVPGLPQPALGDLKGLGHTQAEPAKKGANSYAGTVIKVADGDTLTVQDRDGRKHKIRMHGIDAPESKMAHGKASAEWLSARVLNTTVVIDVSDTDRYQREVAKVWVTPADCREQACQHSQDINLEALKAGQVWWYKDYAKTQTPADRHAYEQAELQARAARIGLWSGPKPQPPWEWRAQQRQAQQQ